MSSSNQLHRTNTTIGIPDSFQWRDHWNPQKISVIIVQQQQSAASQFRSLLRFQRALSKVVFPVYVPKCLKGVLARRKQQLAFKQSENPATTAKRDHAGQNVNLREREPQKINEVDNTFFVDLRNSSSAERLRHSEEIGQKIYMKEKQLNVQSKVHLYVGRLFGETILKLLQYCQKSNRKSGYMRVYRSHLVRCGWIRESEDMGIFCLMQLAMAMCLNLENASSPWR